MNVLLVDDEAMMRKMVKLTLQRHGFQVFDAANGADALVLSEQHKIDVLVTDLIMREMDGWTLARSLVEQYPDLAVLFISGYPINFEEDRQRYGRCAFLPKPFQPGALVDAISEIAAITAV
jgi:CheY-like chemotaxis protein